MIIDTHTYCRELDDSLDEMNQKLSNISLENRDHHQVNNNQLPMKGFLSCKYHSLGCDFSVASMLEHELHVCSFRPTRCPSLTCGDWPSAAMLSQHIREAVKKIKKCLKFKCWVNGKILEFETKLQILIFFRRVVSVSSMMGECEAGMWW